MMSEMTRAYSESQSTEIRAMQHEKPSSSTNLADGKASSELYQHFSASVDVGGLCKMGQGLINNTQS